MIPKHVIHTERSQDVLVCYGFTYNVYVDGVLKGNIEEIKEGKGNLKVINEGDLIKLIIPAEWVTRGSRLYIEHVPIMK